MTTISAFTCTIPAGTIPPATHTVNIEVFTSQVTRIRWRVPPGPRGTLSWFLSMGGVQVLPDAQGVSIVADNEWDDWYVPDLPNTGAWQLTGSNTGTFNHSVYLEMFTTPVGQTVQGGDIMTGFPTSEADIPGLFLT